MPLNASTAADAIARVEALVHRAESLPDPAARELSIELVRAVMAVHKEALARIVEFASEGEREGCLESMVSDELVSSVLVLHDVHPEDVPARIDRLMQRLSRHFDSRGAHLEFLGLGGDGLRFRYTGRSGNSAVRQQIEDAVYEVAPEVSSVVIEGIEEKPAVDFIPLSVLTAAHT